MKRKKINKLYNKEYEFNEGEASLLSKSFSSSITLPLSVKIEVRRSFLPHGERRKEREQTL